MDLLRVKKSKKYIKTKRQETNKNFLDKVRNYHNCIPKEISDLIKCDR